jgi:hypothetical protein
MVTYKLAVTEKKMNDDFEVTKKTVEVFNCTHLIAKNYACILFCPLQTLYIFKTYGMGNVHGVCCPIVFCMRFQTIHNVNISVSNS